MTNQEDSALPKGGLGNFSLANDFSEPKTRTVLAFLSGEETFIEYMSDDGFHIHLFAFCLFEQKQKQPKIILKQRQEHCKKQLIRIVCQTSP